MDWIQLSRIKSVNGEFLSIVFNLWVPQKYD